MADNKKPNKHNRNVIGGKAKTTSDAIPKAKVTAKKPGEDSGMVWPNIPPLPQAIPLALQFSFQVSEWWPTERLLENQMCQISALVRHAATSVPYYHEKLRDHLLPSLSHMTVDAFQTLPLLRRADIQSAGKALASKAIPSSHGKPFEIRSSGSTGRPIRVLGTGLTGVYVRALSMRGHLWHRRDLSAKNVDIRTARASGNPNRKFRWSIVPDAGESVRLDINLPIDVLLEQLMHEDPVYLQTHPYTLKGLIESSVERGIRPKSLRQVRTFGEALDQGIRDAARTYWDVEVINNYSAMEIGTIAHQCPKSENLHVQSESVLFEVLGDDGTPCSPGEVGRVVITALHNFATPLIRYEIGDYAEVGEPCACGRGLPVLKRILGRQRNFLVLPTGEKRFPEARMILMDLAPEIRQFQLVQKTVENIEIKLAVTTPLANSKELQIAHHLNEKFGHPFDFQFIYVEDIPRSANGKFEEFKSEVL
jgi:phenylacetate-CoA ligase